MSVSKEHAIDCPCRICLDTKGTVMHRRWSERVLRDWGITGEGKKVSKPNDGGPASEKSIRAYFSGKALVGILAAGAHPSVDPSSHPVPAVTAKSCVNIADALIAELEREGK